MGRGASQGKRRNSLPQEDGLKPKAASFLTVAAKGLKGQTANKRIRLDLDDTPSTAKATIPSGSAVMADSLTPVSAAEGANHAGASGTSSPSRKRVKHETDTGSQDHLREAHVSPLLTIPPEIFSEIVLSTSSPADALSLSMTCKSLYASLSLPQSSFIWSSLRRNVGRNHNWEVAVQMIDNNHKYSDEEKEKRLVGMYGLPDWEAIELENGGWKGMLFKSEQEFLGFAYGIGVGAGPRKCEVCRNDTPHGKPYDSYALRISLCDNRGCRKSFITNHLISGRHPRAKELGGDELHDSLRPCLESRLEGEYRGVNSEFGQGAAPNRDKRIYRKDVLSFERTARSVLEMGEEQRNQVLAREKIRMAGWSKLCDELVLWRKKRRDYYSKMKRANDGRCHVLAKEHGWSPEDLLNCTDYGAFHRNKNRVVERVSDADVAVLLPTITSQMAIRIAKRNRSAQDAVYHTFRDQITSYHKYLVKANLSPDTCAPRDRYLILPALSAFRDLEIMRMLVTAHIELPNATSGSSLSSRSYESSYAKGKNVGRGWRDSVKAVVKQGDIGRSLRGDKVLGVIIRDQVGKWIESTREGLRKVLAQASTTLPDAFGSICIEEGNVEPANAEVKVEEDAEKITTKGENLDLDPESFATRFRCKQCSVYDGDYTEDECLDFRGVCMHECTVNGVKGNRKAKWSVENFEGDDKGMAVLRRIVEEARKKFGQDEKGMDTFLGFSYAPHGKSAAPVWRKEVLCLSCEVPMLMTLKSAIGHSHRHEDMQIEVVWSRYETDVKLETRKLLGEYREYPLVPEGTTRKMMSKSREKKPKEEGSEVEVAGTKEVKKGKGAGKGKVKGKGKAKANVDVKGKGKGEQKDLSREETHERDALGEVDEKTEKKVQKEERKFACRHCHNIQFLSGVRAATEKASKESEEQTEADALELVATSSDVAALLSDSGDSEPIERTPPFMGWNGMRSHLRAKHSIASIRDEDYFMKQEPSFPFTVQYHHGASSWGGAIFYLGAF